MQSPQAQTAAQIPHEVYGLNQYPVNPLYLLLSAIGILILGSLAFFLWRKYKNRTMKSDVVQIHPLQQLKDQLDQLRIEVPFNPKRQIQFYFELGMVFRGVIEHICGFPATDMTLKELRAPLKSLLPLEADEISRVIHFFEKCDLIKFAGITSNEHEAEDFQNEINVWSRRMISEYLTKENEQRVASLSPSC